MGDIGIENRDHNSVKIESNLDNVIEPPEVAHTVACGLDPSGGRWSIVWNVYDK
jgi:hypothetical protein